MVMSYKIKIYLILYKLCYHKCSILLWYGKYYVILITTMATKVLILFFISPVINVRTVVIMDGRTTSKQKGTNNKNKMEKNENQY